MYVCMYVCMYKQDLALNNQQGLICHKTQPISHNFCLDENLESLCLVNDSSVTSKHCDCHNKGGSSSSPTLKITCISL